MTSVGGLAALREGLFELIAPTRCAGCDLPGALLCDSCAAELLGPEQTRPCPRCGAPYGSLVCTECWSTEFAFEGSVALGSLEGALARAVVLHKDAGEERLGSLLGAMLAERVASEWPGWPDAVTWIPPTRAALDRRGFDHAAAIARPVASRLCVPVVPLLSRGRARDQRRLGRMARKRAARGTFVASDQAAGRVLLVDDVFTTGATLDAAAEALLAAGAQVVRNAIVARAW